ncbi:UMP kinase [Candidatus Peregrinibacteria bacterium]|jgi:uridylate kinase|nr:UMP kinase [Candidatus Peregrinibacteria bacterium]
MYKRILLKLSGEAMQGSLGQGFDYDSVQKIAEEIISLQKKGHEVAVVLGAGNIWRYRDTKESGIKRTRSDALGMTATVMNSVVLQSALESLSAKTRVVSSFPTPKLAENFLADTGKKYLSDGKILLCAGGTGNPYFTTDSAAALRALELECDVIIKATKVDGVYDSDPEKNSSAKKYDILSFDEAIEKNLKVMDQSAFSLCKEGGMKIIVLNMNTSGNIEKAASGEKVGTLVC